MRSRTLQQLFLRQSARIQRIPALPRLHLRSMSSSPDYGSYPAPKPEQAELVVSKLSAVRDRISKAASSSNVAAPRLVAVSKLHPPSSILAAHIKGEQLHFGENYAQEMRDKSRVLPRSIRWHYVGAMQTSKAKMLAAIPNLWLVETLDGSKSASALDKALANRKREEPLRVYLQVNTSGEEAKAGLEPKPSDDGAWELLEAAKHIVEECSHIEFLGLMTIGAREATDSEGPNPDFETLIKARSELVEKLRASKPTINNALPESVKKQYAELLDAGKKPEDVLELSMGMSGDLEEAVRAGSSNVRVGTDCFGTRPGSRDEAMEGMKHELEWDGKDDEER